MYEWSHMGEKDTHTFHEDDMRQSLRHLETLETGRPSVASAIDYLGVEHTDAVTPRCPAKHALDYTIHAPRDGDVPHTSASIASSATTVENRLRSRRSSRFQLGGNPSVLGFYPLAISRRLQLSSRLVSHPRALGARGQTPTSRVTLPERLQRNPSALA